VPDGRSPFQYAVWRVVPDVARGERLNAGVVLLARTRGFVGARVALDRRRLAALDPTVDADEVARHLEGLVRVAEGREDAGPIARLSPSERFHQLVAPASTIVQPSAVHTGVCDDPAAMLEHLFARVVLPPGTAAESPSGEYGEGRPTRDAEGAP
jgi:hypothetical protein